MIRVEGILKEDPDIVIKGSTIKTIAEKLVKETNHEIYKRLQVLKSSSTKVAHSTEKVNSEISQLNQLWLSNEKAIQQYVVELQGLVRQ